MDFLSAVRAWDNIDAQTVLVIIIVAWIAMMTVRYALRQLADRLPMPYRLHVLPWIPGLRFLILIAAIILAIPHVFHTTGESLLVVIGTAGLALGFAIKDYVSSVIAGAVSLLERSYRVGDWIEYGGHYGEVKKVGFRAVHLATVDDNEIIVPHANAWTATVLNATSGSVKLQCAVNFYLHPEHDAALAKSILTQVAQANELADHEKPVIVTVREILGATQYIVRVYANDSREQYALMTGVTVDGKSALNQSGIKFAAFHYGLPISN